MLQIKDVRKEYVTGDLKTVALDGVSLNLRDNEFVAILGASGSGKTTLLNVIGGLDRYDSGDLIIDGISTKEYDDRDWDSYRNHSVGFVFQNYNLISHQTVLANVELALTISGISMEERKQRATEALEKVGLGDQLEKKPNQLSGGQMQRVAIARALVNNPSVLLADEPTGALDSKTSIQVMELLKEVAKDRLVVMVTHNPDLANQYANRIINLKDGQIVGDSNPYKLNAIEEGTARHENMGRSSMSFLTALQLSFNNLRTKTGRTLLTAFAGSIGIIGIALILAFSSGVRDYIDSLQRETMLSYPISIQEESINMEGVVDTFIGKHKDDVVAKEDHKKDGHSVYSTGGELQLEAQANLGVQSNNLANFKKYLEDPNSDIHKYIGSNGIMYQYGTSFKAYTHDPKGTLIDTDDVYIDPNDVPTIGSSLDIMGTDNTAAQFGELLPGTDSLISDAILDSYEVVYGTWPTAYNEVVLVVNSNDELPLALLYKCGYLPADEYDSLRQQIDNAEAVDVPSYQLSFDTLRNKTFYVVPACDQYHLQPDGTYSYIANNGDMLEAILPNEIPVKVVGLIKSKPDSEYELKGYIGYTTELTKEILKRTDASEIVKKQKANHDIDVLTGEKFASESDIQGQMDNYAKLFGLSNSLTSMATQLMSATNYEDNLEAFGVVDPEKPKGISIYVDSFEDKDKIEACIDKYNEGVEEGDRITYTDMVGLLMDSVTKIVDAISYVLIGFVAVSLIVSSIMIGIITFISVLERTKEIGILRALGASKKNISNVFNAETFFIGLLSGIIGVIVAALLCIPVNAILDAFTNSIGIAASLPWYDAIVLIVLSIGLTVLAGLIPAKKASKKDPVVALRSE